MSRGWVKWDDVKHVVTTPAVRADLTYVDVPVTDVIIDGAQRVVRREVGGALGFNAAAPTPTDIRIMALDDAYTLGLTIMQIMVTAPTLIDNEGSSLFRALFRLCRGMIELDPSVRVSGARAYKLFQGLKRYATEA